MFNDIDQSLLEEKYREIIKESPMVGGKSYGELLDHREFRVEKAQALIKDGEIFDTISIRSINFSVYIERRNEYHIYNFISNEPELRAYFLLKENTGGVYSGGVWQRHQDYGLARELVFEYILNKWKFFVSDSMQYIQGEVFWRKLLERAEKENNKISIIDKANGDEIEYDSLNYNEYSGRGQYFANFLFKIYK